MQHTHCLARVWFPCEDCWEARIHELAVVGRTSLGSTANTWGYG